MKHKVNFKKVTKKKHLLTTKILKLKAIKNGKVAM